MTLHCVIVNWEFLWVFSDGSIWLQVTAKTDKKWHRKFIFPILIIFTRIVKSIKRRKSRSSSRRISRSSRSSRYVLYSVYREERGGGGHSDLCRGRSKGDLGKRGERSSSTSWSRPTLFYVVYILVRREYKGHRFWAWHGKDDWKVVWLNFALSEDLVR